ncbi:MAG: hypothetical protein C5B60_12580 [Chloroflexi bacterium]|nr:MAG: hypothetical protein C5B60_12580 [Chloroflexota bacterium]
MSTNTEVINFIADGNDMDRVRAEIARQSGGGTIAQWIRTAIREKLDRSEARSTAQSSTAESTKLNAHA